jgi:hypothetical protein
MGTPTGWWVLLQADTGARPKKDSKHNHKHLASRSACLKRRTNKEQTP